MKTFSKIFLIIVLIISCSQKFQSEISKNDSIKTEKDSVKISVSQEDKCLAEFNNLRNYIYQKKKDSIKKYFIFPIKDTLSTMNLWSLALNDKGNYKVIFTEKDFDKYFDKLFSLEYVKCLLKVKSEILFEKGEYETPYISEKIEEDEGATEVRTSMHATFNKKTKILSLTIGSEGYNGNEKKWEAGMIQYDFQYDENCNLKFYRLFIAG